MKRGKRMAMLLSLLLSLSLLSVSALAEEYKPGDVVDGSVLVLEESASDMTELIEGGSASFGSPALSSELAFPVAGTEEILTNTGIVPFGTYLAQGGCGISRIADNIALMEGFTSCYRTAEYLYLGLYMDRLEDGYWHTVLYKEVEALNTYNLYYNVKVLVKPGYYYRMRAAHVATNGPVEEGNTSFTNGIWFG